MPDFLKKVIPGQPMKIPAGAYNAFVDAANDYKSRQSNVGRNPDSKPLQNCVVSVQNDTTTVLDRFAVVGIDAPVFTPEDSLDEFLARFAVKGVKPTLADHVFRFGILIEPAGIGEVAWAVFAGVTPAKIDITDANHQYAGIADNVTGNLQSYPSGPATILWKEAGTGVKWAIVRLDGPSASAAPADTPVTVYLTMDGGSAGSTTTNCTYTYTIATTSGVTLATGLIPERGRWDKMEYYYAGEQYMDGTYRVTSRFGLAVQPAGYPWSGTQWLLLEAYGEFAKDQDCT